MPQDVLQGCQGYYLVDIWESFFARTNTAPNFPCIDGCRMVTEREISKKGSVTNGWMSTITAVGNQSYPCYTDVLYLLCDVEVMDVKR